MSVREFLDQVLHATRFFFDNMRPPKTPNSGTDKNTLKWANRGYDMAVSQVKYAIFVNGLRAEIRNELRKTKIDPTELATVDTKKDTDFITKNENLFQDLFNKAIGIEESIRGGYGTSLSQAPVGSENEPNDTAIVGFTRGRGRFQNSPNFGSSGNFRGPFRSNFGYNNTRGRGSSAPQSPQSTPIKCFRCSGFNHYARDCKTTPLRGQSSIRRGTPWQRRAINIISDSQNGHPESIEPVQTNDDQKDRFEEIQTIDALTDAFDDILSSHVRANTTQHNNKQNLN